MSRPCPAPDVTVECQSSGPSPVRGGARAGDPGTLWRRSRRLQVTGLWGSPPSSLCANQPPVCDVPAERLGRIDFDSANFWTKRWLSKHGRSARVETAHVEVGLKIRRPRGVVRVVRLAPRAELVPVEVRRQELERRVLLEGRPLEAVAAPGQRVLDGRDAAGRLRERRGDAQVERARAAARVDVVGVRRLGLELVAHGRELVRDGLDLRGREVELAAPHGRLRGTRIFDPTSTRASSNGVDETLQKEQSIRPKITRIDFELENI